MKKDNLLNGLNITADNAGEKKKILDGCEFCMSVNGVKCSEATKLFDDKHVLSPYSPCFYRSTIDLYDFSEHKRPLNLPCFSGGVYRLYEQEKPLNFPLRCFHDCRFAAYACENCNITYKPRYNDKGCYKESCPICGTLPDCVIKQYSWGNEYFYSNIYPLDAFYCHNCEIVYLERYNVENRCLHFNNKCPHCGELGDCLQDIIESIYFPLPQIEIAMDEERLEDMYYTNHPEFVNEEMWFDERTEDIFKNRPMSENDIKEARKLAESIFETR